MTDTPEKTTLTNREVALALDLSESGVSRLRSGDRLPSLSLMQRIEAAYSWPVQNQSDARSIDAWHDKFAKVLEMAARGYRDDGSPL